MTLTIIALSALVLYLLIRVEVLKADVIIEREIADEDVKFYSDAYHTLKGQK